MLLAASYFFYGYWDWRFLSLIFASTLINFVCGQSIHNSRSDKSEKTILTFNVIFNLGVLFIFKYFNFFSLTLNKAFNLMGLPLSPIVLDIVLPVGISFYTFQAMSYTIDIYRKQLNPTKSFLDFALFISFFPQLIAGPIERATHLLPQILKPRKVTLDWFYEGCFLVFWGLYLKIFIADNLAKIVNPIFSLNAPYDGGQVLYGMYAFAFQIYCDFAGYSLIARGLGRMMGFDIMWNFNNPYLATNPSDFWKRWHISLSSWIRDYVYIPLGGSRNGNFNTYKNLFIAMVLCGLWHGASIHFVAWGAYHAFLLIAYKMIKPYLKQKNETYAGVEHNFSHYTKMFIFFHITCLGWLIFRAGSMIQIKQMLYGLIFNFNFTKLLHSIFIDRSLIFFTFLIILAKFFTYHKNDHMYLYRAPVLVRSIFYYICFYSMIIYGASNGSEFIYFQF